MITRKELESMGVMMTDEQWKEFCGQMAEVEEQIWNEEHPLDD